MRTNPGSHRRPSSIILSPQSARLYEIQALLDGQEFESLDDALGWAWHLDQCGQTALLIIGDDGTRLTKQEIAATLHHPQYAKYGKPAA